MPDRMQSILPKEDDLKKSLKLLAESMKQLERGDIKQIDDGLLRRISFLGQGRIRNGNINLFNQSLEQLEGLNDGLSGVSTEKLLGHRSIMQFLVENIKSAFNIY